MKKTVRFLTLAGMGVLAGASLGMGPAQAASAAGHNGAGASVQQRPNNWGGDDVVGYYRNIRTCLQAGHIGERFGAWDDYDCERVRFGFRRGAWALVVDENDWDNRWDNRWRPGQWPSNWTCRPTWPGLGGPDRPGLGGFHRPGQGGFDRPGQGGFDQHGPGGFDQHGPGGFDQHGPGGFDQHGPGGFDQHGPGGFGQSGPSGPSQSGPGGFGHRGPGDNN